MVAKNNTKNTGTQTTSQAQVGVKYKLSSKTIEELKYYVYTLSDPRTNKVFYVGKGHGNRINQHLLGALKENTKETEKVKTIRDIQEAGLEVGLDIIRHGLEKEEVLEVEGAIIDIIGIKNLTNIVLGHNSNTKGKMTLRDIEIQYQAKPAEFDKSEPVVLIRINQSFRYDMAAKELYEATRKDWVVGERVHGFKVACAVYAGIIREVYSVKEWVFSPDRPERYMFNGKIAQNDIRDKYINKSVAHIWKEGSMNPIKYID